VRAVTRATLALVIDLKALARYRFEGKSEQAVREEWIAPLLVHLGYAGETLNTVLYNESFALAKPFRRIGRQRIEVDYRPTVLGHGLWIIEAKAHGEEDWDDAISQAWFYATHPEIDVPFMVICDGSRIAVYDSYKPDWDEPVVDIPTAQLAERFQELAAVIGAAHVTRAVRERRLRHLGDAMRAELDPVRLNEYVQEVQRLARDATKNVRDNEIAIIRDQLMKEDEGRRELVRAAGLFTVGVFTNQPFALNLESARLGVEYVQDLEPAQRAPELARLMDAAVHRGGPNGSEHPRAFWMLRITALEIYLSLLDDDGCGQRALELAKQAVRDHLLNFPEDPVARAAHRLERVLPVFALRSLLTSEGLDLAQVARDVQQSWGDEARLRARLDKDRLLVELTTNMSLAVWNSVRWDEDSLDSVAHTLEAAIPSLDYRQDGARGPAGDPFLESVLRIDDLVSITLQKIVEHFRPSLLDEEVVAAVKRMAEAGYEIEDRFIKEPARHLLDLLSSV
jgi:hypothetical protein